MRTESSPLHCRLPEHFQPVPRSGRFEGQWLLRKQALRLGIRCSAFALLALTSIGAAMAQMPTPGCAIATPRFVGDARGVLDTGTGLTWSRCNLSRGFDAATQKCNDAAYVTDTLEAALRAMPALSRESGDNWRLPTVAELRAVFDLGCTRAEKDRSPFAGLDGTPLWSSSVDAAGKVWQLDPEGNQGRPEYYTVERGAATVIGVRAGKR